MGIRPAKHEDRNKRNDIDATVHAATEKGTKWRTLLHRNGRPVTVTSGALPSKLQPQGRQTSSSNMPAGVLYLSTSGGAAAAPYYKISPITVKWVFPLVSERSCFALWFPKKTRWKLGKTIKEGHYSTYHWVKSFPTVFTLLRIPGFQFFVD